MIFKLVLHLISLLWLMEQSAAAPPPVAKPGCQASCGNVIIPYPFGSGDRTCYHDEWFEITCKNSKPFLRKVNLEVSNISLLNHEVKVNSPTASLCNSSSNPWTSINLGGSPFHFSYKNVFTVMGCHGALLRQGGEILAGCTPTCKEITTKGCNGINCCQTPIPVGVANYSIITMNNATATCTYAFLVENSWLSSGNFSSPPVVLNYAPVVLGWVMKDLPINSSSESMCYSGEINWVPSYSCGCQDAYDGNPYVSDGCQVVEACAKCKPENCMKNRGGKYFCIRRKKSKLPVILGFSMGGGSSLLLLGSYWLCKVLTKNNKLKEKLFGRNGGLKSQKMLSAEGGFPEEGDAGEGEETNGLKKEEGAVRELRAGEETTIFTSEELKKATDNFNENRIYSPRGQGTFYKGILADGKMVAIRKSKVVDESEIEQFINDVDTLSQINHKNIVKLLGCCLETKIPLLVYEFINNGTLFELLYDSDEEFPLSWELRLRISSEVAGVLSYLDSKLASLPIYRQEIKSTNILLDNKYRVKVSNFGISGTASTNQAHLTTLVQDTFSYSNQDTFSYSDPEDIQSSQFTEKCNVYNFGVILVELLTGRKLITSTRSREVKILVEHFIMSLEKTRLFDILDARVIKEGGKTEIMAVANLAKQCLNLNEKKRPTMEKVVVELEGIRKSHMPSTTPRNVQKGECSAEMKGPSDGATTSTRSCSDYIAGAFSTDDII